MNVHKSDDFIADAKFAISRPRAVPRAIAEKDFRL
jgi:hypothetical protein